MSNKENLFDDVANRIHNLTFHQWKNSSIADLFGVQVACLVPATSSVVSLEKMMISTTTRETENE